MINWFLNLEPVNRILLLAACAALLFLAIPGVKINLRNLVRAIILVVAALLLYTFFFHESPMSLLEKPAAVQKAPISVPQYYKDPEKRWQENR